MTQLPMYTATREQKADNLVEQVLDHTLRSFHVEAVQIFGMRINVRQFIFPHIKATPYPVKKAFLDGLKAILKEWP